MSTPIFGTALAVLALSIASCKARGVQDQSEALSAPSAPEAAAATSEPNAWLEIDVAAFEANARTLQAAIGRTRICAVLKADAYGHGIELLMPSIVSLGLPCVAVTSNEEARLVRRAGFAKQLLRIRTATPVEMEQALELDVDESLGNVELARTLSSLAERAGKTVRVHLALNSGGMSRNGLHAKEDALEIAKLPGLKVVGIMTHFAVEDKADVRKGLAAFNDEAAWIMAQARLDRRQVTLHAANSYATLEVPESRLDMVRPGGALYGDTVPTYTEYKRVMAFKSRVASVNSYPAGNTVSYDRTFELKRASRLANVPVGYSDGYRRAFSNKTHVLIRGQRRPIVGRVTMNTVMVDVTDDPEVRPGDEVVLFGKQGAAEVTQSELEKAADTILADLYTIWGTSNPRVKAAASSPPVSRP